MATNISIRNLSRTPIRVGGHSILSTASQVVDIDLGAVRRDLHHTEGQWVVASAGAGSLTPSVAITDQGAITAATAATVSLADAPAGGTGATGGAYDTAGHRDTAIALINQLKVDLNKNTTDTTTLVTEVTSIRTKLNSVLATLRTNGIVTP